jgi:hypothetical protein
MDALQSGRITGNPECAGINPDECCALIPGHENGFEQHALTSDRMLLIIAPIAEVKDAAGLVAMTPWLKLYPAGILYP